MSVYRRENGSLYMEGVRLCRLLTAGLPTPFFVYSAAQLDADWQAYAQAVQGSAAVVAYAVKANHNPVLMQRLRDRGAAATVVSAEELYHARALGFGTTNLLLHGSGKRMQDVDAALAAGALLSIDSEFDLAHVDERAAALGKTARVLLRVNPDIDPQVHPYICTGLHDSKFGMTEASIEVLRPRLKQLPRLSVHGLHCHLGSTLRSVTPVRDAARLLVPLIGRLRADGHPIDTLDAGGGLGIDYHHHAAPEDQPDNKPGLPTPSELVAPLLELTRELGLRLWLEPGRSLVGRAGALIGRFLGSKHTERRRFLVVDASMAQLIRPCLYQAYHHIELLEPTDSAPELCDVVGPVCESADFLGRDRRLGTPREGDGVIIYDTGAYGFAMASRYNLQLLCAEYLIDGDNLSCIRRAETYADFARTFSDQKVLLP